MEITVYSFITAVLWSNFLVIALIFLRKNNRIILKLGIGSLIFLCLASLFRLFVSVDIHGFTQVIPLNKRFTDFIHFIFNEKVFVFGKDFLNSSILLLIWILVGFILLLRLLVSQIIGIRFYQKSFVYGDYQKKAWDIADKIATKLKITNCMEIIVTNNTSVPVMSGLFKLRIFLPNADYSEETLNNILLHEMTHFKNKDTHYKLLTKIICSVLWWNIPIWFLYTTLDYSLELRCDYRVIESMDRQERTNYLQSLCDVSIVKQILEKNLIKATLPAFSLGMIKQKKDRSLLQRMKIITQYENQSRVPNSLMMVLCILFSIFFISSFAFVIQPYSEPIYDEKVVFSEDSYVVDLKNGDVCIYLGIDTYGDEEVLICSYEDYIETMSNIPIIDGKIN